MKIIQVIADSSLSGGPRHVVDLLAGYKRTYPDWELHLICSPGGWLPGVAKNIAEVHSLPIQSGLQRAAHRELTAILTTLVTGNQPTILHFQGVRAGIAAGFVLPKLNQKPTVTLYTEHRYTKEYHLKNPLREKLQLWALKRSLRQMDQVIAVSKAVADFLKEKSLADPAKVITIPNGVAIPDQRSPKINPGSEKNPHYLIGAAGSLIPVKGFQDVIEAMPLVLQNLPQVQLVIVGEGPLRNELLKKIRGLHLTKSVEIVPNESDLTQRMQGWNLLISPSHVESFGMIIAEAMAAELPVIAARCGATEELITSETGCLVAPHSPHELAKAIIDLLPQAQRRQAMGAAGRKRIEEHFTVERMATQTAELYEFLINQKSDLKNQNVMKNLE